MTLLTHCDLTMTSIDLDPILDLSGCDGELDLVIAIDRSGSIPVERFRQVLNFMSDVVQNLEIWQDRVNKQTPS